MASIQRDRALATRSLIALTNAGEMPDGMTPVGVAKMAAKAAVDNGDPAAVELSTYGMLLASVEERKHGDSDIVPGPWIELIPAPRDGAAEGHVETRDWREGFLLDAEAIVAAFDAEPAERRAKPVDWEHRGHRNWDSDRNPAAAWIGELQVRDGAVWGRAEWTDIGLTDVTAKPGIPARYRYISPVVSLQWAIDTEGNIDWDKLPTATRLVDAALTNNPATYIRDLAHTPAGEDGDMNSSGGADALAASHALPRSAARGRAETETEMKLSTESLSALGLGAGATEDDINKAINLKCSTAEPPKAPEPTVATFDMASMVAAVKAEIEPELTAARDELAALKAKESTSADALRDVQLNALLDGASAAFKVTPAMRAGLMKLGVAAGADALREHIDALPSMSNLGREVGKGQTGKPNGALALSADELKTCTQLQISPAEFAKQKAIEAGEEPAADEDDEDDEDDAT